MSEAQNAPQTEQPKTYKKTLNALGVFFAVYILLLLIGLPQKWTNAQFTEHTHKETTETKTAQENDLSLLPLREQGEETQDADSKSTVKANAVSEVEGSEKASKTPFPPFWTSLPFIILLLCIAILPLIPITERWWENNLHRFIVASALGLVTLCYYAFLCDFPIDLHWPGHKVVDPSSGGLARAGAVFVNAILGEYVSFIVLLFSLFTITGGVRISGDLKASPLHNTIILGLGSLMASFVGTTGAAMLLIRLLLDTNKERRYKIHTVVFFIFCVCNVGGCLLPIGDPPLFLGYLRGVNFLWTFHLFPEWAFVCGVLLAIYFLLDKFFYYPKEMGLDKALDIVERQPLKIYGLRPNIFLLFGVILAVMLLDPAQEFLSLFGIKTNWRPPMFLREFVQLLMVWCSFKFGSNAIRQKNGFNFSAILEVAALFFGIFICMQAPLQILHAKGSQIVASADRYGSKLNLNEAQDFFWMSGCLSAVLDNAPTYVVFFETARAAAEADLANALKTGEMEKAEEIEKTLDNGKKSSGVSIPLALLVAVSLGSVFMGAMTYIGNGPNFMVKAIAEQSGVKMPSFFGYIGYSIVFLLPTLVLMTLIFL